MAITLNGTTGITTPDVDSTDLTATGNFTSRGIDDNATSTAMTLDTSGNLLVGMTSNGLTSTGIGLVPNAVSHMYSAGNGTNATLMLGRGSNDGNILSFNRSGTTVGSIGANSSAPYFATAVGSNLVGLKIQGGSAPRIVPTNGSGVSTDNYADLGVDAHRFKDLYLSGGVYLGGTGAANKLDDYEEGTFTPIFTASSTAPTVTYSNQSGRYVKIGGMVFVWIRLTLLSSSGGSGTAQISGLPYTIKNEDSMYANSGGMVDQVVSDSRQVSFQGDVGTTKITLIQDGGSTSSHGGFSPTEFGQSSDIRTQFAYFTDS